MESPGEYLKRERELRGVSLQEISEKLRLSVKRLERLEKDDYERLPHPTYVRGFIRSYCRELGLDENDAVLRFEAYLKEQSKKEKDSVPEHEEGLQRPWLRSNTAMVIFLVFAGVLVIFLYSVFSGRTKEGMQPPLKGIPAEISGETIKKEGAAEETSIESAARETSAGETSENTPEKLVLDVHAKAATWLKAEIDGNKPVEMLIRDGESVRLEADKVFF